MSETIDLGDSGLSPEENAFFESGGKTELPAGDKAAGEGEGSAATETTTPDPTEAAKAETDKVEKMVSLSALHEERGRRKATETEKRQLENQLAELREIGRASCRERV